MPRSLNNQESPFEPTGHNPPTNPSGEKRPRGRPPEGTPDWAPRFIGALMEGASVRRATKAAGVDLTTPYERRKRDEEFRNAWVEAADIGTEFLEQEAARRAFHGTLKPVFHKGERCGFVRDYSDTLMIFLLKARRPEKYREGVEDAGAAGRPLVLNVNVINTERIEGAPRVINELPAVDVEVVGGGSEHQDGDDPRVPEAGAVPPE